MSHTAKIISIATLLIIVFCALFFSHKNTEKNNKLVVICTTSMITDAVKKIGGDLIDVHGLMGCGVDPHIYLSLIHI